MKFNRCIFILFCLASVALSRCNRKVAGQSPVNTPASNNNKGLKDYYKDYFTIGVAVTPAKD